MNITTLSGFTRILTILLLMIFYGTAMAGTDSTQIRWFSNAEATSGWSHLTRTGGMIIVTMEVAELVPGDVYTLWWVVFNTPAGCTDGCGEDEIFNEDGSLNVAGVLAAGISIGNASGNVAKSDGTLEFGARMPRSGDTGGHQLLFTPYVFGAGEETDYLLYASSNDDAEVHVIVQSHGQARGGNQLMGQLSMVEKNCTPGCADVQFAVHMP